MTSLVLSFFVGGLAFLVPKYQLQSCFYSYVLRGNQTKKYNTVMENIGDWLNNNQGIVTVVIFSITILMGWISGLFKWLIGLFKPKKAEMNISSGKNLSVSGDIIQGKNNVKTTNNTFIHHSKTSTPPDIDFRMTSNYRVTNPKGAVFGKLTTSSPSSVAKFTFLDSKEQPIGRGTKFQKIVSTDTELIANYFIEIEENQELLLQSIYKRHGYLYALVTLTNGEAYIYKYEAQGNGWKVSVDENHPNLMDTYILVGKESYSKLSEEAYEILTEISDTSQNKIYQLSTDQTGRFIRAGKRDFTENATNYCEALDELLNAGLVKHTSGQLYELTSAGKEKAKLLSS